MARKANQAAINGSTNIITQSLHHDAPKNGVGYLKVKFLQPKILLMMFSASCKNLSRWVGLIPVLLGEKMWSGGVCGQTKGLE